MKLLNDSESEMLNDFLGDYLDSLKVIHSELKATTPEILVSLNFVSAGSGVSVVNAFFTTVERGLKNLRSMQKNSDLEGLIQHVQECRARPGWGLGFPILCCFEKPGQTQKTFWFSLLEEKFIPPVRAGRN